MSPPARAVSGRSASLFERRSLRIESKPSHRDIGGYTCWNVYTVCVSGLSVSSTSPYISKTEFLNYLTCPGYAWCARHQSDLLPPPDDGALRRMRDGQKVELLARETLPPGRTITFRAGRVVEGFSQQGIPPHRLDLLSLLPRKPNPRVQHPPPSLKPASPPVPMHSSALKTAGT